MNSRSAGKAQDDHVAPIATPRELWSPRLARPLPERIAMEFSCRDTVEPSCNRGQLTDGQRVTVAWSVTRP